MSQFFETIKLLDGKLHLLDLHSKRLNATREAFFENVKPLDLEKHLELPCSYASGLYKVKLVYSKYLESMDIEEYHIKDHKVVALVEDSSVNYKYKFLDRGVLTKDLREGIDDVIFVKNGELTDATYSNLALFDGQDWFSPQSCLLEGVKRTALLNEGKIRLKPILAEDLSSFQKIAFINAMRDFEKIYTFVQKDNLLILNPCQ
jgi:4-amino-4-deoxychorismate lyase